MDVYYFVIAITFLLCYIIKVPAHDEKAYLKKVIWVFMPIMIYGALRVDFGIDYANYEAEFNLLNGHPENIDVDYIHSELGYQWLEVIIPSWRLLVVLVSSLVVLGYVYLYYRYVQPEFFFFVVIFTFLYPDQSFFLNFVAMRNGLAISGFFFIIPLIIERKYLYAILIAIALSFIHTSAIIFIVMAILIGQNIKVTRIEQIIWANIIIVLAIMPTSELIERVLPFMKADAFESYRERYLIDSGHSSWLYGSVCCFFIYWILSWAMRNREVLSSAQNVIWRLGLLYLMCPFLGPIGRTRMNYYFFPFYIISLSYLFLDKWPNRIEKMLFICLAVAVMFYATFVVWMNNPLFPYSHYNSIFH